METSLRLDFAGENPELIRIVFTHPLSGGARVSERGHGPGLTTFFWSRSVRALGIFFIRALLCPEQETALTPILEGSDGSAAASLDYAIARQSPWLLDAFGTDADGIGIIRRIVRRSNPERKRPGPVGIFLNPHALEPQRIAIMLNGKQVSSASDLQSIVELLERDWTGKPHRAKKKFRPSRQPILVDAA